MNALPLGFWLALAVVAMATGLVVYDAMRDHRRRHDWRRRMR